jgi:hypothetical protein
VTACVPRRVAAATARAAAVAVALAAAHVPALAHARDRKPDAQVIASGEATPETRALARVLVEQAQVYSGPGFGYRVIASTARDDVLEMVERGKRGGWTRVKLDSGITGWILSEQVLIFAASGEATAEPSRIRRFGQRLRATVLGPPNFQTARIGGALSAGALGSEGLFLVRPSVFITPHVAVEAYLGPSAGRESSRGIFGLSTNLYLSPSIPFTVFVSLGAGAMLTRGKADALADAAWSQLLSPGGGMWVIFKRGIGLRFDFRNHVSFRADAVAQLQEYSGAIAFTF